MRALITGAQGFIGRYLTAEVLQCDRKAEVLGTGRSPECAGFFSHELQGCGRAPLSASLQNTPDGRYRYAQADVLDRAKMRELIEWFAPEYIFHMASGLRDDPVEDLVSKNIAGTAALMSSVVASGLRPTVVLGSSGGVYGRITAEQLPLTEETVVDPADVYAVTKLAAEQIGRIAGRDHGVPVVVGRIFNVVGAGQDERHVCGRLARELHVLMRSGGSDLLVGSLDTTRDFVDVRDVARALLLLARCGVPDGIYNVGSGVETAVREVLQCLASIAGYAGGWYESGVSSRQSDVPRHRADISRLSMLGFVPRYSLRESLQEVYSYYRDREAKNSDGV